MKATLPLRSAILFLGFPVLWLGSASIASQTSGAPDSGDLTLIPVAVHAAYTANYSVNKSIRFTPIEEDILNAALGDQGIDQPALPSNGEATVPQTPTRRDSDAGSTQTTDTKGNRGKSVSSPGHSADEHGNDKKE